jgi:hypothetical protein
LLYATWSSERTSRSRTSRRTTPYRDAGLRAVHHPESVVHKNVRELRQLLRKAVVVCDIAGVEAGVLEQQHLRAGNGCRRDS